jgi:pimeloyl-ACP methyl ester carboxylesterase
MLMAAMPKTLSPSDRTRYRTAWSQPGAITSMIHWYRASLRNLDKSTLSPVIKVPTLILWGRHDPYLSYEMAPLSLGFCELGRLETFEDATHWVLFDQPQETSQFLIDHFMYTNGQKETDALRTDC